VIASAAHPDANIIFGAVIDDALGDEVRVTVIAAGFDRSEPVERPYESPLQRHTQTQAQPEPEREESVWPTTSAAARYAAIRRASQAALQAQAEEAPQPVEPTRSRSGEGDDDLDIPSFLKR